ncbi:MAG: hypothetical protein HW409_575, partial [candidate division NC10 bacterium]|nr:hypothetical protein [candidate division NC10 bacterium]
AREIDDLLSKEIEEAVAFAEASPFPEGKDLLDGVYASLWSSPFTKGKAFIVHGRKAERGLAFFSGLRTMNSEL